MPYHANRAIRINQTNDRVLIYAVGEARAIHERALLKHHGRSLFGFRRFPESQAHARSLDVESHIEFREAGSDQAKYVAYLDRLDYRYVGDVLGNLGHSEDKHRILRLAARDVSEVGRTRRPPPRSQLRNIDRDASDTARLGTRRDCDWWKKMRGNLEPVTPTGYARAPFYVPSQTLKGNYCLSDQGNSGNLLQLVYRARQRIPARLTQPSPECSSAFLPKARLIVVSTTGPSHYAAIPLMSSMELGLKCEVQSKGFSQPSYSRSDARSIEAGDYGIDSTRQVDNRSHRRSCVSTEERDRDVQGRYAGAATEAVHKETNPPAKIKLGHFPSALQI